MGKTAGYWYKRDNAHSWELITFDFVGEVKDFRLPAQGMVSMAFICSHMSEDEIERYRLATCRFYDS